MYPPISQWKAVVGITLCLCKPSLLEQEDCGQFLPSPYLPLTYTVSCRVPTPPTHQALAGKEEERRAESSLPSAFVAWHWSTLLSGDAHVLVPSLMGAVVWFAQKYRLPAESPWPGPSLLQLTILISPSASGF